MHFILHKRSFLRRMFLRYIKLAQRTRVFSNKGKETMAIIFIKVAISFFFLSLYFWHFLYEDAFYIDFAALARKIVKGSQSISIHPFSMFLSEYWRWKMQEINVKVYHKVAIKHKNHQIKWMELRNHD